MAKRFTDTNKWEDKRFREMEPVEKLLYLYILDHCDIAGFWEIDLELASFKIGVKASRLGKALESLGDRFACNSKTLWVKNFLKHQKNANLNLNNKTHLGIIRRMANNKCLAKQALEYIGKPELLKILDDYG